MFTLLSMYTIMYTSAKEFTGAEKWRNKMTRPIEITAAEFLGNISSVNGGVATIDGFELKITSRTTDEEIDALASEINLMDDLFDGCSINYELTGIIGHLTYLRDECD